MTDDRPVQAARTPRGRRDARRLAVARLISISGSIAASVALASVLYERTGSAAWVAGGALATSLVAGTVTPLTGSLADRMDRRRLMIGSDLAACAAFALLAVFIAVDAAPLLLVVAAGVGAICETPFVPASRAALPNLVDDSDLPWANGLLGQVAGLSFAVGPLIGGALAGFVSPTAAMAFNAASFVASALLVISIRQSFQRLGFATSQRTRGAVRAGFRFVTEDRLLRAIIVSGFVAFIGVGFIIAANPAFADLEGNGAVGLGCLWTGWGVGSIVGAGFAPRLLMPGREVSVAVLGFGLQAAAILAASVLPFWVAVVGLAVGGLGGGIADPARQTLVQRRAPDAIRGRVASVMEAVGWSSFAVSLVAAGILVDRIGIRPSYMVAGVLFVAGTLLMIVLAGTKALRWRTRSNAVVSLEQQ
jgi:MFS family permease